MNRRWTDDQLRDAVATSHNIKEVLIKLQGSFIAGGNYKMFHRHVARLKLDTSHFNNDARSSGLRAHVDSHKITKADLVQDSTVSPSHLRLFLIRNNIIPYRCGGCDNDGTWCGKTLSLQLDHENGVRSDNRIQNLRFLCPNCHSQTPTYARIKNTGVVQRQDDGP